MEPRTQGAPVIVFTVQLIIVFVFFSGFRVFAQALLLYCFCPVMLFLFCLFNVFCVFVLFLCCICDFVLAL